MFSIFKGVFDISAFIPLVLGALLLILGLKNYKSQKENFDVRYFRYATGISLLLSGLARLFIRANRIWIIIIPIILIMVLHSIIDYHNYLKHPEYSIPFYVDLAFISVAYCIPITMGFLLSAILKKKLTE